jgi:hypothetical protein
MNSRRLVEKALRHEETDKVPLDLGGSAVTGMHVSTVYGLRQVLCLDKLGTPVKVVEPFQMLGEIAPDLQEALGVDVVGLVGRNNMFGYENKGWKPWTTFDETPVLVPSDFNTEPTEDGYIPMYPKGDRNVSPSAHMPMNGFYFDATERQSPLDWKNLDYKDNIADFRAVTDEDLRYIGKETSRLYATGKAILANFGGTSFGDIALVPGLDMSYPKGIRGVKEWYMAHVRRPDIIEKIYRHQLTIALDNLERIYDVVGDKVSVVFITGTDFGSQLRPILSVASYRKLYKPYHIAVNNWVHENTMWKTFIHSCGSVEPLIAEFIEAGFDILNPVQTSAANMEAEKLKKKYGDSITFWGGGVDTQRTLPFGSPQEVYAEVRERVQVFKRGGGFVFNTIHNVQPKVPIDNVIAMYNAVKEP